MSDEDKLNLIELVIASFYEGSLISYARRRAMAEEILKALKDERLP